MSSVWAAGVRRGSDRVFTIQQAAVELECSYSTVQRAVKERIIPSFRITPHKPVIPKAALDKCLLEGGLRSLRQNEPSEDS